jgi:hypothetical protein
MALSLDTRPATRWAATPFKFKEPLLLGGQTPTKFDARALPLSSQ